MRALESGIETQGFSGHIDAVASVAFSPDGKYVLTGSNDHTARLWGSGYGSQATNSGQVIRTFSGHTDFVTIVAFSPDGKYVLTGGADNTPRLWV